MKTINPMIPVFIASPSEVRKERKLVESAIHLLAHRFARLFGVTMVPLLWEEFAPISSFDAAHPQVGILRRIQPFSIFIGILWNRCGTTVGQSNETGTEQEFFHAMKHRETISILTYFRSQTKVTAKEKKFKSEQEKVKELKLKLQNQNILIGDYNNLGDFSRRILPDVMESCLELVLTKEPKKIANYYNFFKFGSHWRVASGPLLIAYPPITDPGPNYEKPKLDWQNRLLPHVIYEDFKTIQDIEEVMRLLGREYKTVTTDSPTLDMAESGDRIWVCVPRNKKAHRILEELKKQNVKIKFNFDSIKLAKKKLETILYWDNGKNNIKIRSPLTKYLRWSARPLVKDEWKPAYGFSYCRDYAIFARFKLYKDFEDRRGEFFYHYFIGGIRGLGTWGVGHLIDHQSSMLVRIANQQILSDETADIQMLLEVTYENFRVTRAIDVSNMDEAFFTERYNEKYIKEHLERHSDWLPKSICNT